VPAQFGGSIPEYYDRILVAAQFDAFALDLAGRLPARPPGDLLEIACGTGAVTRRLRERLDSSLRVVATDVSKPMLDYGRGKFAAVAGIEWREADACRLPFADASFGAAACSFGVMFFPDKPAAFRETRRVLRKGGRFVFSVWDSLENNLHSRANAEVMDELFPGDPEMQWGRTPYAFNDPALIRGLLEQAGFAEPKFDKVRRPVECASAREWATGQMRGTPRGALIEQRGRSLDEVIDKVALALARIGGGRPFKAQAQALLIEAVAA
jgi:SAM-dependent methyltransferase